MKLVIPPLQLNLQQVQHLQYHIYVFNFVHVLYTKLLQILGHRRYTRVTNRKWFRGIFVVIRKHLKGYLVYLPHKIKIISSYDVVFYDIFSSGLAYASGPYSEAIFMRPGVLYVPHATYSKGKTGNIITFGYI